MYATPVSMDSMNCGLCCTVVFTIEKKKATCKRTGAVQIHIAQESNGYDILEKANHGVNKKINGYQRSSQSMKRINGDGF